MSIRKKPVQQAHRPTSGAASRIYSRENVGRYAERARQRRRGRVVRRGILVGILGVLLVGVVAAGAWVTSLMSRLNDGEVITSDLLQILTDYDVAREPFYMLHLGTDGRPGEDTYRTDSIILARIDPTEKQVTLISVPRDTRYVYQGSTVKINAVFSYGGADDMVEAVNDLCGVEISEYAEINFDGMKALVDAVGGIDIYVPEGDEVDDPEAGPVAIESGQQHMDGEAALTFSRARHQFADGDYTRMRHQRMVLGALAEKILNNLDIATVPALMNQLADMVKTSLQVSDIVALINAMRGSVCCTSGNPYFIDLVDLRRQGLLDDEELKSAERKLRNDVDYGDLYENSNEDWRYGTATTTSSVDEEDLAEDGETVTE